MENGEDFFIEFFNGSSYQVIGQYVSGSDFSNGAFFTDTIVLDSGSYSFNANNRIRVRCDASANNDQIWFDQVIVSGDNALTTTDNSKEDSGTVLKSFTRTSIDNIKLYPNPTNSMLNIEILEGSYDVITIFSTSGKLIHQGEPGVNKLSVDVSQFGSGMYFVRFVSNGKAVTKRFIKE